MGDQAANGPPAGVDTHKFYGLTNFDFEDVDAKQATAKLSHDFGDGLTLRGQTSWGTDAMVASALSNQTSLTSSFRRGGIDHAVASGVGAPREKARFASYALSKACPASRISSIRIRTTSTRAA